MALFEITLTSRREYHFRLLDIRNNKTIISGKRYTTKNACREGIDFVKNNAPYIYRYETDDADNGEYYFNLKAADGQVIGKSEAYATAVDRDNGIALMRAQAARACVTDLT